MEQDITHGIAIEIYDKKNYYKKLVEQNKWIQDFVILKEIDAGNQLSKDIAKNLQISASAVSQLVANLRHRRLVHATKPVDKRALNLELTERGRNFLKGKFKIKK